MNVQELLRQQMSMSHGLLQQVMADVSDDIRFQRLDGATIDCIGHVYAHVVHGEDRLLNGMVRGQAPVWVSAGFAERLGIQPGGPGLPDPAIYDRIAAIAPAELSAYAEQVFAATDAYLAGADDAEMARIVPTGFMGDLPAAVVVANLLVWHATHHTGEIAAIKGVLGHKGLPF